MTCSRVILKKSSPNRLSADRRPTVGQLLGVCRPTVDKLSADRLFGELFFKITQNSTNVKFFNHLKQENSVTEGRNHSSDFGDYSGMAERLLSFDFQNESKEVDTFKKVCMFRFLCKETTCIYCLNVESFSWVFWKS